MLGGIAGDLIASCYVGQPGIVGNFALLTPASRFTGTSVMIAATAAGILAASERHFQKLDKKTTGQMRAWYHQYPDRGYDPALVAWLTPHDVPPPYDGGGLESSVRAALCGWISDDLRAVRAYARRVAKVTHNYSLALRDAELVATAVLMSRQGATISQIRDSLTDYYRLSHKTLHHLRDVAHAHRDYQPGLRVSLQAFFESHSFESAVRGSLSVGGDMCSLAAITGLIAGAYYGVPSNLYAQVLIRLDPQLVGVLTDFENQYVPFRGD